MGDRRGGRQQQEKHGRLHGSATLRGYDRPPQLLRRKEDQIAIRIRIPEAPNDLVHVAPAPLCEAVLSLHVLMHPKEHPLQHPWIRQMRRLTPALKQEIRAFGFLYSQITADFMLPERAETPQTFEDAIESFAALPADWARYELARPTFFYLHEDAGGPESLGREEVRAQIRRQVSAYGPDGAVLAEQLLDDPAAVQARVAAMLGAYWEQSFAAEWTRLEPILAAEVERAKGVDPIVLLGAVRSELRVDAQQRLLVRQSFHDHDVGVEAANPLRLIPSVYVWPHVRVNCDPPWPLAVLYPPASMRSRRAGTSPPAGLVKGLRAVADPTRLQILRLIGEQPRSTEELAPLVGLSESGLSKHLRALTNAGLISSGRSGWYVLYRLERRTLEQLGPDLLRFLGA